MGTCFSKRGSSSGSVGFCSSSSKVEIFATKPDTMSKPNSNPNPQPVEEVQAQREEEARAEKEESLVKKHRKSHDRAAQQPPKVPDGVATACSSLESADPEMKVKREIDSSTNFTLNGKDSVCPTGAAVRTSSCTKEEVDAILIQCGRLSQVASGSAECSRKYSGSKRSYDFDHNEANDNDDNEEGTTTEERLHRERSRQAGASPQGRRRRTPSREREQQSLRSNSKERSSGGGSGSRRVSRSPGKRNSSSASNVDVPSVSANSNASGGVIGRPGKLVSVPATVSTMAMEKGSNGGGEPAAVKRINVKRNVGEAGAVGSRSAASPRALSPAGIRVSGMNENPRARSPARGNANGFGENVRNRSPARGNANGFGDNQQPSLSRNGSRKAEQSPFRRNPLSEIDPNSLAYPQPTKAGQTNANNSSRVHIKSKEIEADGKKPNVGQGSNHKISSRGTVENKVKNVSCSAKEQQTTLEEAKEQTQVIRNVVPQTLTRSRSSRLSQDLDLNPETLLNPNPSYTSLLLEDIHNFHQKSTIDPKSVSLPPCVTKAHSILEAMAELNGIPGSILSCTLPTDQFSRNDHILPSATILAGKKRGQHKDPFVESEVIVDDDLMEPSFHKYVTVRSGRGGQLSGGELEEEESSGSNSYAGNGGQHWGVSSSWEPNSADSTDRWTSRSNTKENYQNSLESGRTMEEDKRGFSGKMRDFDNQQTGIGRGKVGGSGGPQAVVVAAST